MLDTATAITREGHLLRDDHPGHGTQAEPAPITRDFDGTDALSFVISQNLHRRHLTVTQRAMMAERVANMRHGGTGANQYNRAELSKDDSATEPDRKTRQQAAAELDVSEPSLDRAVALLSLSAGTPGEVMDAMQGDYEH